MEFKLEDVLKRQKISQKKIADELNLSTSLINQYVKEKCYPSYEILCKIADYLHITTDELLGRPTSLINLAILNNTQREIIERVQNMPDKEQEYTLLFLKMRDNSL